MKTRVAAFAALMLALAVILPGCGEDLTEKVQGVWKIAEGQKSIFGSDKGGFIEITKDKMIFDDETEKTLDVVLEEKDGKVALRRAGTQDIFAVAGFAEGDALEFSLTMPGMERLTGGAEMKIRLLRSSKEELNSLYHPPVDKITGFWRTETEAAALDSSFIEIAADAVSVDGAKIPGTFATEKGAYIFTHTDGGRGERYFFNKDGKLVRSRGGMSFPQVLVPSSPEEAAAAAEAKRDAIAAHFGFWKKTRTGFSGKKVEYLDLGAAAIDENGVTAQAEPMYAPGEVQWFKPGDAKPFMTTTLDGEGRLNVSQGYFSDEVYERSNRELVEKMNSPALEDFIGYWLPVEEGSGSFRAVEIGADYVVSDNSRAAVKVGATRTNAIDLVRVLPRASLAVTLSHADDGSIRLKYDNSYGEGGFSFRRAEKSEYDAVAGTVVDPRTVIPGFWRSSETVTNREVYATAVFELDVQGENGQVVDRGSWLLVDPRLRNLTINNQARAREGWFVTPDGRRDNPLVLTDDPGGNRSWLQIRVEGPDALLIAVDYEEYMRFVRCTEEELTRERERIAAMR